ncbi:Branched-chain amino acid transport ATP-binding protein LivF [Castellaniella defragrans 65Phen]|uniref:Branched-chain amino acid transport ATP-binding protein LivF n=2 Tax=Castellaniella defragrans TaxID=75697 RepID=W8X131_CASD6|nr:ATP-binding cassette domain-containing protein [Castellaniella defragrans]MBB6082068.1 branched-chain amino acid transport system ATP-binding protein [Castellaniella defragrans]CDM22992.1 Branched-chain amino acid transport ATP-binding protein LivF [Castellaniella defragrans 65Phen]
MHALDIIQEEHRNLWRIATTMDWVANELEAGQPVEEGFFTALFDYIQEFMDGCHHAKEEQYLFSAMHRRAPEAVAAVLDPLEKEHRDGPQSLAALRGFLGQGSLAAQPAFIAGLREYARQLKQHIRTEEKDAFPLAREILLDEDWEGITAAFSDHRDPLFGEQARAEYRELYHRIVALAPEAIGLGGRQAGGFQHLSRGREPLLQVQDLESCYGRIQALKGISLEVHKGELVALVGANGAGKTTFLRALSGIQPISAGRIRFAGQDISRQRADRRVRAGICHSPEGRQVFGPLSIEDNLRLGAYLRPPAGVAADLERVYTMFPVLHEKRHLPAGTLSGGQQQMLAISRALMGHPRLLLLDEPSMGLAPLLVEEVFNVIRTLKAQGITILLVEQNAFAALGIADRAYVLETGHIVLSGTGQEMISNEQVRAAYLGM